MTSPPGGSLLPPGDREAFAQQFEKDLQFFQLLLLLLNKSCPLKNVDLAWTGARASGSGKTGPRERTGTAEALAASCCDLLACDRGNPTPRFCAIVSDDGRHFGCRLSDAAAEERVRRTGRAEVYRCHAGLIDIAVPVISAGLHIATLFSGQVMTEPPSPAGFAEVRRRVRSFDHIREDELQDAYRQVPVVSEEDLRRTAGILELFADYLGTAWKRLKDAGEAQQRRLREQQLQRKELAHILLDGDAADRAGLRDLGRAAGFSQYPNRLLVVQAGTEEDSGVRSELASTRVLYVVEEVTAKLEDVMAVSLRHRGTCVFFCDQGPGDARALALAQKILHGVAQETGLTVRIGIGRAKGDWHQLSESYQEARTALNESAQSVATYREPADAARALSEQVTLLCRSLAARELKEARAGLRKIPVLVNRHLGEKLDDLPTQRQFLLTTVEEMIGSAVKVGFEREAVDEFRRRWCSRLESTPNALELQETWVAAGETLLDELEWLYAGRHEKLVARARAIIERALTRDDRIPSLSLAGVAAAVGVSAGHLSRTFKRITGQTFERYLMERHIERAQRLLLNPLSRVSEVAEKCDFCNPAYFARVFRLIAGCSPTEYSKNPGRVRSTAATQ